MLSVMNSLLFVSSKSRVIRPLYWVDPNESVKSFSVLLEFRKTSDKGHETLIRLKSPIMKIFLWLLIL